jgi:hypothetical protein
LNKDGTLRYLEMNATNENDVFNGKMPTKNDNRISHPNIEALARTKIDLKRLVEKAPPPVYLSKQELDRRYKEMAEEQGVDLFYYDDEDEIPTVDVGDIEDVF